MSRLLKSSYYFPLQISIDDREPPALEEAFCKMGNMIIHRQRLLVGDYLLDCDLLVERKTIPDFCKSIKDGRLFQQAKKLSKSKVPACLMLEGRKRDFKQTDFLPQAIQGILLSISLSFRIPILRTKNTKESAAVMLQCFKQLTKDKLEEQRFYHRPVPFKRKSQALLKQRIHILEGFPGIGVDRAERLLMKFGNLHGVFTARQEELLKVPGVGKRTVDQLYKILKK
ncbi:ERCC4 domain-containing protein [Cyclobacterium sp.]|uniref:ERCC4 domain-containing protein n=1 Tax=Cyclobacterium sp. TaxID=1966343 RepID=UPI00199F2502|nr:ERCC4 domain-containing protein [Cyclobacterium sp.]MBD3628451.1 hypothetical protein [Cyclobacterium sp.]